MLTYCIAVIITTVAAESYVVFVGAAAPDDKVHMSLPCVRVCAALSALFRHSVSLVNRVSPLRPQSPKRTSLDGHPVALAGWPSKPIFPPQPEALKLNLCLILNPNLLKRKSCSPSPPCPMAHRLRQCSVPWHLLSCPSSAAFS